MAERAEPRQELRLVIPCCRDAGYLAKSESVEPEGWRDIWTATLNGHAVRFSRGWASAQPSSAHPLALGQQRKLNRRVPEAFSWPAMPWPIGSISLRAV